MAQSVDAGAEAGADASSEGTERQGRVEPRAF